MDIVFLGIIVFLFLLAIFDLSVGVSNDAVNFLNSAIGTKAAPYKRIIIVASIGIFIGAAMSNGMMDIARHGIFRPEQFSFYDLICIFMAVVVTDIILLDIFNSLGMPTSTTVSMVFELLGATFVVSLIKMASDTTGLQFNDLLNTEKALSVILGIFLSVAIAFFFGTLVQFITRAVFSFNYRSNLKWKIGLFGGICATAIVYFLLIKGCKDMSIMTPEAKAWIDHHTLIIIAGCFAGFTLLMQALHALGVNVLKVIVLMGTFSLAMAFAGNDLVNFIGVPLSGLSAYSDYAANGGGDAYGFMMDSLNGPADTSIWFLVGAGVIMIVSLATSKKARKVSQTEIGLGSQAGGDEMFGSSRIARRLVRWTLSFISWLRSITPPEMRRWFGRRFNSDETIMEQGAAFDLIRGSVNLVLAGTLIALGTSLKLPLSTTFVTFMVAMGTSLADRAWGRESAVFRITGVISVIGGWFLTAGVAFIGAGVIVLLMHLGGHWVMFGLGVVTILIIIRSNRRFRNKATTEDSDNMFRTILTTKDSTQLWPLFRSYVLGQQMAFLEYASGAYSAVTTAFMKEDVGTLNKTANSLQKGKSTLKNTRRKETLCLQQLPHPVALEISSWFYLGNNCCMSILYNLRRINEFCKEHVENNFHPLPKEFSENFGIICDRVSVVFNDIFATMDNSMTETVPLLRRNCDALKDLIAETCQSVHDRVRDGKPSEMTVLYVYLNALYETRDLVSSLRRYLRPYACFMDYKGLAAIEVNEQSQKSATS